jgi:hypothetical protein
MGIDAAALRSEELLKLDRRGADELADAQAVFVVSLASIQVDE